MSTNAYIFDDAAMGIGPIPREQAAAKLSADLGVMLATVRAHCDNCGGWPCDPDCPTLQEQRDEVDDAKSDEDRRR